MTSDDLSARDPARPQLLILEQWVRELLLEQPNGWTEHRLIRTLMEPPYQLFQADCLRNSHSLFQVHFILFHVLYRLADAFRAERRGNLRISALDIRLLPYDTGTPGLAAPDPLRAYYLDWGQFENTTAEDVEALLNSFWRGINPVQLTDGERAEALKTLELDETADQVLIKQQYRRLVMRHHPDRGGDPEKLKRINEAMDILTRPL